MVDRVRAGLTAARQYNVPPHMVMGPRTLDTWRRRLGRLNRALIRGGHNPAAIRAARRRLETGR